MIETPFGVAKLLTEYFLHPNGLITNRYTGEIYEKDY